MQDEAQVKNIKQTNQDQHPQNQNKTEQPTTIVSKCENKEQSPQRYELKTEGFDQSLLSPPSKLQSQSTVNKLNWTKVLYDHNIFIDSQAYRKWNNDLQFQGKQLLQKDLVRTRANEAFFQKQSTKEMIRRIITFYCKNNKISYQQGLLQVVIPFVLLHRKDFELRKCYAYFNAFMRKHFPKVLTQRVIFEKKELPHALLAISLGMILLRYHYPQIYTLFVENQIYLSSILTQQILTVFAKNLSIPFVYKVYDYFINKKDKNSILFMSIALIGMNEQQIQLAGISDQLPSFVNKDLKSFIKSESNLATWFQLSQKIEKETPPSFISFSRNLGFTNHSVLTREDLIGMLKIEQFLTQQDYIMPIYLKQVMGKMESPQSYQYQNGGGNNNGSPNGITAFEQKSQKVSRQIVPAQEKFILISIDGRSFPNYQSVNIKKHMKVDEGITSSSSKNQLKKCELTNIRTLKKILGQKIAVLCETKQGKSQEQRALLIAFAKKMRQSKQLYSTKILYLQEKLGASSQCVIF